MQSIKTHGRTFTGIVIEDAMQLTATVEWPRRKYSKKYERYQTARTRVKAHNPLEVNAKKGDLVKLMECRPISKTKHFMIIEKVGHERMFKAKQELMEESKVKKETKQEEQNDESS